MSKVLKGLVVIITLSLLVQCMNGMETSYASEPTRPATQSTPTYQTTTTNKSTTVATTTTTTKPVATLKPDPRVADYKAANPGYQAVKYAWKIQDGREATITLYIDVNAYKYYSSLDRYYLFKEYDIVCEAINFAYILYKYHLT